MEESAEKPNEEIEREIMEELSKEPAMMKNKKHVLGILAIAILVSGIVGYNYPERRGALATPQRTIAVTSTSDSGPGTLRRALLEAQSGDAITFDPAVFPPEAPATIYLTSSLPPITQGDLTIDGSNAGVVLDGSTITDERVNGLEIASDGNIIRGLQIISFPNAAVGLLGGAQNSTVGGDRVVGAGPLGQGNLLSGNGSFGVGIWDADTSFNTIIGNYVGTDLSGTAAWGIRRDGVHINGASHNQVIHNLISGNGQSGVYICCTGEGNTIRDNHIGTDISGLNPLGNLQFGVAIDWGARDNVIGRDNIIAHNNVDGIAILGSNSLGNTITRNSIHDNGRQGIYLWEGGNTDLPAPLIFDFALDAGTVTGAACANCAVEIFSDNTDEGEIYEGRTIADSLGVITFNKGVSFTGPHLTATATDADGNTSPFSAPTSGTSRSTNLQEGNNLPKTRLEPKQSRELEDNRIGDMWSLERIEEWNLDQVINTGLKWVRVSIDWMDWIQVESTGAYSEYYVDPEQDNAITDLADNGIKIMYVLVYWDEAIQVEEGYSRFKTEEEIQRYLDYVQFIVHHFKDRIEYYEILNEPNIDKDPSSQQYVELDDYINLVKRTVPVIREEHPEAKIVVGAFTPFLEYRGPDIAPLLEFEYFFGILSSDVMPLVDAVSWHAMSGTSPEYGEEYYYNYPSLLQEIKDVASSRGFEGEYIAEELHWLTPMNPSPNEYSEYSETTAAKYLARGIVMHLGTDITTGLAETGHELQIPKMRVIRNLCTIMAGAEPVSLPAEIQSEATNIRSYSFSLPNGDTLIALWTDGVAVEEDPGVKTNLTFQGFTAQDVTGIDILDGFQQPIIASDENGNLVISNLLVRDYPLMLRLSPDTTAPSITRLWIRPETPTVEDAASVSAEVQDETSVKDVLLHWTFLGEWKATPMELEGEGVYTATISQQPSNTTVTLYIEASDPSGNTALSDRISYTVRKPTYHTELLENYEALLGQLESVKAERDSLRQTVQTLQMTASQLEEEISQLQEQIARAEGDTAILEQGLSEKTAQLEDTRRELSSAQNLLEEKDVRINELEAEASSLRATIERLEREAAEKESSLTEQEQETVSATEQVRAWQLATVVGAVAVLLLTILVVRERKSQKRRRV